MYHTAYYLTNLYFPSNFLLISLSSSVVIIEHAIIIAANIHIPEPSPDNIETK